MKIVSNSHEESEYAISVCPLQEDLDLGRIFRNHLKYITCYHLEQALLSLLLKHKTTVALAGDALGKTDMIQHRMKVKPGTQLIYIGCHIQMLKQ